MKLVETDIRHAEDEAPEAPTPPRPEHRRVYVSLLLTLSVLAATVVAVYSLFPKRDNEVLTVALREHRDPGTLDLERPTRREIAAWSVGVIGRGAPWPEPAPELEPLGTRSLDILERPAALVRYRAGGHEVTLLATRARLAPPRKFRREAEGLYAVSWREGKWRLVAVGPAAGSETWGEILGVP